MKLNDSTLRAYQRTRRPEHRHLICHAPFTNINFEQNGNMTACCFNRTHVLGTYPQQSIHDAWFGAKAEELRDRIHDNDLGGGCKLCGELIASGNFEGSRAKHYDQNAYPPKDGWRDRIGRLLGRGHKDLPKVFEFEISNTCNLACTMCSGYFSSTIRRKREKLPPLVTPYDEAFIDQVADFMPGLTDMKFLGGEPFLIKPYFEIWERARAINPDIRLHITTNATKVNARIADLMRSLPAGFVISIDSVDPVNYPRIRQGADLDEVLANIQTLKSIATDNGTYMTIAACVMRSNWQDLPGLVDYANRQGFNIHFNLVWNPEHESIRFLSGYEIADIVQRLHDELDGMTARDDRSRSNIRHLEQVVASLDHWAKERSEVPKEFAPDPARLADVRDDSPRVQCELLDWHIAYYAGDLSGADLLARVRTLQKDVGSASFFHHYLQMARRFSSVAFPDRDNAVLDDRIQLVLRELGALDQVDEAVNEMLQSGLISQIDFLYGTPEQQILDTLRAKFYHPGHVS